MRIVIGEDSGLLRAMLLSTLAGYGLDVVGAAGDLPSLLRTVEDTDPDLVILDIRMPPGYSDEGLQAAERIHAGHPAAGLLVLSQYAETGYAQRLLELRARALGYLVKDRVQDADRLVEAITRVGAGEVVVDPEVIHQVLRRPRVDDPLEPLTRSERDVLALLAEGYSNSAISRKLSYSGKTVEKRITAIAQKLGLPQVLDVDRADVNIRVLAVLTYLRSAR